MTHGDMDDHESAINYLKRCVAVSHQGDSHLRKAYALLASSLKEAGRLDPRSGDRWLRVWRESQGLATVGYAFDGNPKVWGAWLRVCVRCHSCSSTFVRNASTSADASISFIVGVPAPWPARVSMRIRTGLSPW